MHVFIDFAGLGPSVAETIRNLKAGGFVCVTISFSTSSFKKASDGLAVVEVSLSRSTGKINKVVFQLHIYVASKLHPIPDCVNAVYILVQNKDDQQMGLNLIFLTKKCFILTDVVLRSPSFFTISGTYMKRILFVWTHFSWNR